MDLHIQKEARTRNAAKTENARHPKLVKNNNLVGTPIIYRSDAEEHDMFNPETTVQHLLNIDINQLMKITIF